ncbi:hypothetical protein GGR57DRAFT_502594 [Xylariaceae sp. FL1272]|nr:hypothetical protein GGR57DRAFT_502594 [Xylariaceae sp. FL1272]
MSDMANDGPYPEIGENGLFYTKDLLRQYEEEVAKDSDVMEFRTIQGYEYKEERFVGGVKPFDIPQGQSALRPLITLNNERSYNTWAAGPKSSPWRSVEVVTWGAKGPWKTEEQARDSFAKTLREFEVSDEAKNIEQLIKNNLAGCNIDKVFGFGLGSVCWATRGPSELRNWSIQGHEREHAALIIVARAIQQVSSADKLRIFVQDPIYNYADKQVLGEVGIEVIECWGVLGFTMVDDNSAVFVHHPSFSFREIIADMARPKLICMESQEGIDSQRGDEDFEYKAEHGSKRSRKMLEQYRMESLTGIVKTFFHNVWYVREENREVKTETPRENDTQLPSADDAQPPKENESLGAESLGLNDKKKKKRKNKGRKQ